jgi:hypothetical protein
MADRVEIKRRGWLAGSVARGSMLAIALAVSGALPQIAVAQDAVAAAAPDAKLVKQVEDFWHAAKLGRYDAASKLAEGVLGAGAAPVDLLAAFEQVSSVRKDDLGAWTIRLLGTKELAEPMTKINAILTEGRYARRSDPKFIDQQIQRLIVNPIGYANGVDNLRSSGELAVPQLLSYLQKPQLSHFHDAVRRAIKDMGRQTLAPLVASTSMEDTATLAQVVTLLGDLGYTDTAPYLLRLVNHPAPEVKDATLIALKKLNVDAQSPADAAFYDLAQKLHAGKSSIAADNRNPMAFVWFYNEKEGLNKKDVSPAIYDEVMAMRASEYALELAGSQDGTVSDSALALWLTANYKRQIEVPEGQTDATRAEGQPQAHYYGVTSGPKYLGMALNRALEAGQPATAYEIIRSFQEIVGQNNLDIKGNGASLVSALSYPDRRVRFEAAMALAAAKPAETYEGADLVVPLLGEAVSQTGKPTVLLVLESQDRINELTAALTTAGYDVVGARTASEADAAGRSKPAVDAIIIDTNLAADEVARVRQLSGATLKLKGSARVFLTLTESSSYVDEAKASNLVNTHVGYDAASLVPLVDAARKRAGSLAMDPAVATDYATRSANLLKKLGETGGIYDLAAVKSTLLLGIEDARPEVATAVGAALATLNDVDAQRGLAVRAAVADVPSEVRASLYKSLASSAKSYGNKLNASDVAALEGIVTTEADATVRAAAAEARGALDLPASEAKNIVLQQIKR